MLTTGTPAPPFTGQDHEAEPLSLSDFSGRWLLIWWYPAADTAGCTLQGQSLASNAQKFTEKNCEIVGMSFDSVEDNAAFRANHNFPFPLVSDPDKQIGAAYLAVRDDSESYASFARRISYLINPEGIIVSSYTVIDPGGHATDVLADLEAEQR